MEKTIFFNFPVHCVVAVDKDYGIAKDNIIPWKISEDLTFFRSVTTSCRNNTKINVVLMGRKTWDHIPKIARPLKGRLNVVITSQNFEDSDNLLFFKSIEESVEALNKRTDINNIYICGGASFYNYFLNTYDQLSCLYLTTVHKKYDTTLKIKFDRSNYEPLWRYVYNQIDKNDNSSVMVTYEKLLNKKYTGPIVNDSYLGIYIGSKQVEKIVESKLVEKLVEGEPIEKLVESKLVESKLVEKLVKSEPVESKLVEKLVEGEPVENLEEQHYLNLLNSIITKGHYRQTRNSKTWSLFGNHMEFDLTDGKFPLLTTKKMFLRGIFEELKFFLLGETDTKILEEKGVNIWKGNTCKEFIDSLKLPYCEGDMGPMYGFQLRHFGAEYDGCKFDYTNKGFDQFKLVLDTLKKDKYSRRIMMTTYNPAQVHLGVLPPCHGITVQFGLEGENGLCCHMYQRSADFLLGIPFNIASYALLVNIICELVNNDPEYKGTPFVPCRLTMSLGDYHVYESHLDVVKEQISRKPFLFPTLKITKKVSNINDLKFEDILVTEYVSHPALKASMVA